jgi:hypothetical protein
VIDEPLGEQARDHAFSDATLFSANEMNVTHENP